MAESVAASAADNSLAEVAAAAVSKLETMLTNRMDAMQTDLKSVTDNLLKSAVAAQQTSQFGAISTKQDIGGDESQSAGVSLDSGNKRSYDNFVAYQAPRFADRDRVHFDNMQAITGLAFANVTFALGLCQNLAAVDAHQQCGKNAVWRSSAQE